MQNGHCLGDTLPPSNIPNSYASSGKDRSTRSHEPLRSSPENHCEFGYLSTRRVSPSLPSHPCLCDLLGAEHDRVLEVQGKRRANLSQRVSAQALLGQGMRFGI